jgi:hypothetical protein
MAGAVVPVCNDVVTGKLSWRLWVWRTLHVCGTGTSVGHGQPPAPATALTVSLLWILALRAAGVGVPQ